MKSFRKKAQQRKEEGPALSSGVHSNLQWPGKGKEAVAERAKE